MGVGVMHDDLRRRQPSLWLLLLLALLSSSAISLGAWHLWVNHDRGIRSTQMPAKPFQREDLAPGLIHLRVQGEGYALGYAEGSALKSEILAMADYLRNDALTNGTIGFVKYDVLLGKAWGLDPFIPQRFREEMRGMSDASGVPYADLLYINTFDDLLHIAGCSSAVVVGQGETPLLHGRNLDYHLPRLAQMKLVLDVETRGVRIRSVGFPGYLGVLTGMSSTGLGLTSHTSISDRIQSGEPSGFIYRQMLEDCHSLAEMKAMLEHARRTMGNCLALSDGPGNQALVLEFDAKEVVARSPIEGRAYVTNHYWNKILQSHQSVGFWSAASGSRRRVELMARELPAGAAPDLKQLQLAMNSVATVETVESVVMAPRNGQLWLAKGQRAPVTDGGYLELGAAW
jgi:hypothetical protein